MSGAGHPRADGYNTGSKNRDAGPAGGKRRNLEWK